MFTKNAISLTALPTVEDDDTRLDHDTPLITSENPYEAEITRITHRIPLSEPNRGFFFVAIDLANQADQFWNYNIPSHSRERVQLVSNQLILYATILCGIFTVVFMILMIHRIGMNGFVYTTPMFLILVTSLLMKFLLIRPLDHSTRLLFITKQEVQFIDAMTLLYIVVTAIPYDYFFSTRSREDSNHNHHSIWREKMVFITFNAISSYLLVTYTLIWVTSLMKERKMFRQNFYIVYDGTAVRRPIMPQPTDTLLSHFFVIIQSFMKQYEIAVALDVFLMVAFACLLIFTFFRDDTVGPVDTSMAFIMAYQFLIPFVEFCEINRIDKQISRQFTFRNLGGSRYNNLTIYEMNILVGVLASLVGVMIKVFGFGHP